MQNLKSKNSITTIVLTCILSLFFIANSFAQTSLSFKNSVQYGSQKNNLSVMVSTDFNGDFSPASIQKATWKNITDKFNFATGKEFVESGKVDISNLLESGKPLYIAFKYIGQETPKATQRGWGISDVVLNQKGTDKAFPISSFTIVDAKENKEGATWVKSANLMRFRSNQSTVKNESWAITKAFDKYTK